MEDLKITKIKMASMERCYSCGSLMINGELHLLFAEEEENGKCYDFYGENFENQREVWDQGGGTMSIVPIPGKEGEFLAIQGFLRGFNAKKSKIVWCKLEDGKWKTHDFLEVPYLHRFDIYEAKEGNILVCAQLCEDKKEKEDWSSPGRVLYAPMPETWNEKVELATFEQPIFKNHGYSQCEYKGKKSCFFTGDNGVFQLYENEGNLVLNQITNWAVSDVAFIDLDGDGQEEMLTIAPFHGSEVSVYKERDRTFEKIYDYKQPVEFVHAIGKGKIKGTNSFIFGARKGRMDLVILQHDSQENRIKEIVIEEGAGCANVEIVNLPNKDLIIAANHTNNEAAIYVIE